MRARAGLIAAVSALLAGGALTPAPAAADSRLSVEQGGLRFFSEDAGVANTLEIALDQQGRVQLLDEGDPLGMRFPSPPCDPGRINRQANVVEVFCERAATRTLDVDVGGGEDRVAHRLGDTPAKLAGGLGADVLESAAARDSLAGQQGNDQLDAGPGDDEARGGEGDDVISTGTGDDRASGGPGADRLDAGPGDDIVHTADGTADTADCGAGSDLAVADALDTLTGCEAVERAEVTPADAAAPDDGEAPALSAKAARVQRVGARRGRVRVSARAGEDAIVQVFGYLEAGGVNSRLDGRVVDARAGERRRLALSLSRRQLRRVRADLRAGRRPRVRLTVAAVDDAGNTSPSRRLKVRLRG